jgi:hypothetical protein
MTAKRVEFDLLHFLKNLSEPTFSVTSLNTTYLGTQNCPHQNTKTARQYINRHLGILVDKGIVIRTGSSSAKTLRYVLVSDARDIVTEPTDEYKSKLKSQDDVTKRLREKLKDYKLELLLSIGEAEVCKEVSEEIPTLLKGVQTRYNSSRDKSSKLLGKVNALELIITDYLNAATS